MRQINIRVDDTIAEAFFRLSKKQGIKPTTLLGTIVDFYGRCEILCEQMERGEIAKDEMLVQLGQIVADMQKFSKANSEFRTAIGALLQPYGIRIDDLGLV